MEREGSEEEAEDGGALEQLKFVFNLCDSDKDGVISVEEFRQIGLGHFNNPPSSVSTSRYVLSAVTTLLTLVIVSWRIQTPLYANTHTMPYVYPHDVSSEPSIGRHTKY